MTFVLACAALLLVVHLGIAITRDGRIVVSDPGNLFALILLVYTAFPAAFFILTGFVPSEGGDNRLNILAPGEAEITSLYLLYLAVITGFVFGYWWFMRRAPAAQNLDITVRPSEAMAVYVVYIGVSISLFLIKRAFGLLEIEQHGDFYRNISAMPLILQQIFVTLSAILLCAKIAIAGVLASQRRLWSGTALLLLIFELVVNLDFAGSRRDFVMLFLVLVLTFDLAVKPMRTGVAISLASFSLAAFVGYGFIRSQLGMGQGASLMDVFQTSSEFTAMFATAYDIAQLELSGLASELRFVVLTNPLLSVIPQQISPWPKLSPSDWYVQTMYPAEAESGQGFAFGVVAEAANGWGWIEAAIRGAMIALLLSLIARRFRAGRIPLAIFVGAMLINVGSYDFFRIGVFWFVPIVATRLLPFLAAIWLLSRIFERIAVARQRTRPEAVGGTTSNS